MKEKKRKSRPMCGFIYNQSYPHVHSTCHAKNFFQDIRLESVLVLVCYTINIIYGVHGYLIRKKLKSSERQPRKMLNYCLIKKLQGLVLNLTTHDQYIYSNWNYLSRILLSHWYKCCRKIRDYFHNTCTKDNTYIRYYG